MTERSQNGWPTIPKGTEDQRTKLWTIPGNTRDVQIRLRPGYAGFALAHFVLRFDREIENIEDVGDEHGWSYRPIAGTDEWSNHASATAVDLNSLRHPQGKRDTFTLAQRDKMTDMLAGRYLNLIRAGFTFRTTADDMHFEYVGGPTAIRELSIALFDSPYGRRIREANPWLIWNPMKVA